MEPITRWRLLWSLYGLPRCSQTLYEATVEHCWRLIWPWQPREVRNGSPVHLACIRRTPGWREASRALHASGDDEPYATDEPSETSTPLKETTTWKGSAAGHMFGNDPRD